MKPVTVTLYLLVDEEENPNQWDLSQSWDNPDEIVGWDIADGHGDCPACANNTHEEN